MPSSVHERFAPAHQLRVLRHSFGHGFLHFFACHARDATVPLVAGALEFKGARHRRWSHRGDGAAQFVRAKAIGQFRARRTDIRVLLRVILKALFPVKPTGGVGASQGLAT